MIPELVRSTKTLIGRLPAWPYLWCPVEQFKLIAELLFMRFNRGKRYEQKDVRVLNLGTQEALNRVLLALFWSLLGFCE